MPRGVDVSGESLVTGKNIAFEIMRNRLEQQLSDYNCERCALDSRESNVADGLLDLEGVRKIEVIEQERRAVSYLNDGGEDQHL